MVPELFAISILIISLFVVTTVKEAYFRDIIEVFPSFASFELLLNSFNETLLRLFKGLDNLEKIKSNPNSSQRKLAGELGFSLGKLNYCVKALRSKGLIKIENFKKNPKKINYIYVLTPKGIAEKTKLTVNFMKRKMKEYDELKKELE